MYGYVQVHRPLKGTREGSIILKTFKIIDSAFYWKGVFFIIGPVIISELFIHMLITCVTTSMFLYIIIVFVTIFIFIFHVNTLCL